jgi:hypothetical protein
MNKGTSNKMELFAKQRDELLAALKSRFEKNLGRHPGLVWAKLQAQSLWDCGNAVATFLIRHAARRMSAEFPARIFHHLHPAGTAFSASLGYWRERRSSH